ncbi:MAG: hypothetical protein AABX07_02025 [Nanoarchaeota archaeon]
MTEEKKPARLGEYVKRTLYSLLGAAAIAGTYSAHEGDCPPFYVNKTGNSGGICLGVRVDIKEGAKFYGGVISFYGINGGEINGIRVGFRNASDSGKLNGLEAGFLNIFDTTNSLPAKINGLQVGIGNVMRDGNGLQVGLVNMMRDGNGLQVGLVNMMRDGNGLQVGLANGMRDGNGLQVGLGNKVVCQDKKRYSVGLNYSFEGNNKDKTKAEESKK